MLMINPGGDESGAGGMRINLGDASLMAATNRRGALRATLRGLRGAVGSGRLGGAGRSIRGNNNASADSGSSSDLRSASGSAGRGSSAMGRAIAAVAGAAAASSSRGGGSGRAQQQSASRGGSSRASSGSGASSSGGARINNAVDYLSVEDLEMMPAPQLIPPEDFDDDDEDDEDEDDDDDVDDDDEDDEDDDDDEDEMVDVIEASSASGSGAGRSRNDRDLDLDEDEEFSSASSRLGSSDHRSGGPPPSHAIHIPGVVENAIFGSIGGGRQNEAIVDQVEAMASSFSGPSGQVGSVLVGGENDQQRLRNDEASVGGGPVSALEALLGGRAAAAAAAQLLGSAPPPHPGSVVGFPPILDIPPDADDEAMVELAIALSLQDQGAGGGVGAAAVEPPPPLNLLQNFQAFAEMNSNMEEGVDDEQAVTPPPPPPSSVMEPQSDAAADAGAAAAGLSVAAIVDHGGANGRFSDTTTSGPASDDEGSTAATEGSTLRTSPVADRDADGAVSSAVGAGGGRGCSEEGSADGSVSDEDAAASAGDPSRSGSSACGDLAASSRDGDGKGGPSTTTRDASSSKNAGKASSGGGPPPPPAHGAAQKQLHRLRLLLLEGLLQYMPYLKASGGVRSIPYMQVLLMLTSDLDGSSDQDKQAMDALLNTLMKHLNDFATTHAAAEPAEAALSADAAEDSTPAAPPSDDSIVNRTKSSEVDLIIMRFYSVLMSRTSSKSSSGKSSDNTAMVSNSFTSNATAQSLLKSKAIDFCLKTLQQLLPYWKALEITAAETPSAANETSGGNAGENAGSNASNNATSGNAASTAASTAPGTLIKPHPMASPPDMSPFFLRQYVKGHANDIFEAYPQLLTEMVLRLPLQIKKLTDPSSSSKSSKSAASAMEVVVVTAPSAGVMVEVKEDGAPGHVAPSTPGAPGLVVKSGPFNEVEEQEAVKSKLDETQQSADKPACFNLSGWFKVLCEYMMTQETPFVRRQVRKLLLFICGTKTKVSWMG